MGMLLQFAVPGGPELLVIALVALIVFGIPLALVLVLGALWLRSDDEDYDDRIAELEREIAQLRAELGEDGPASDEGGATDEADASEDRNRS